MVKGTYVVQKQWLRRSTISLFQSDATEAHEILHLFDVQEPRSQSQRRQRNTRLLSKVPKLKASRTPMLSSLCL